MRGMRSTSRHLRRNKQRLTKQQLARQHRPMNQQVVEKMLARHGRQ